MKWMKRGYHHQFLREMACQISNQHHMEQTCILDPILVILVECITNQAMAMEEVIIQRLPTQGTEQTSK